MSQVLSKISSRFAICLFSLSSFPLTDEFANYLFLSLLKSSYRDGSISSCESEKLFFLLILAYLLWFFGNRKENWHNFNFLQTLNTSSLKKEHLIWKKKKATYSNQLAWCWGQLVRINGKFTCRTAFIRWLQKAPMAEKLGIMSFFFLFSSMNLCR